CHVSAMHRLFGLSLHDSLTIFKHLDGNCHLYVDQYADLDKAHDVAVNAKTYRYGICGAMETLLVHANVAESLLPRLGTTLADKRSEEHTSELQSRENLVCSLLL